MARDVWFKIVGTQSKWDKASLDGLGDLTDLKKAIKKEASQTLKDYDAARLTIKAKIGDKEEELGEREKLDPVLKRFGDKEIEFLVILPPAEDHGKKRKMLPSVTPPEKRKRVLESNMVVNGNPCFFQSASQSFRELLLGKGQVYYDRTGYIPVLEELGQCLLFCRPRRFGKTLTISMLEHFHGLQYANERGLYKRLEIQKHINENCTPGQYFVLKFDFSKIVASKDPSEATSNFRGFVNLSIKTFYETYAGYIEQKDDGQNFLTNLENCLKSVQEAIANDEELKNAGVRGLYLLVDEYDCFLQGYIKPYPAEDDTFENTDLGSTFKAFWRTIKSLRSNEKIERIFITGISPLSLTYLGGAFNITKNVSFNHRVAGLCGLTYSELNASLKEIGKSSEECKMTLLEMKRFYDGYHFCMYKKVESVFNPETCLEYLQNIVDEEKPNIENPQNSEVSQDFLNMFSTSAPVIADIQKAMEGNGNGGFTSIDYDSNEFKLNFTLDDLNHNRDNSWRSLFIYFGGLTFDSEHPDKALKIPNEVTSKRVAKAVLQNYKLNLSLQVALESLTTDGNIDGLLGCYRKLMVERIVQKYD